MFRKSNFSDSPKSTSGKFENPQSEQQPQTDTKESKSSSSSRMNTIDIAFLWFGAAVVVDELWSGAQIAPAGLALGIVLIIAGRLFGNLLLGLVAGMGARTGAPTMVLSRISFGIRGSIVPAVCNILQLIGWTAYMLVVATEAVALVFARDLTPTESLVTKVILGLIATAWAVGGSRYWKIANNIAVILLLVLSTVMTYAIFRDSTLAELAAVPSPAGNQPMIIFDFIVAMAVSWVPLAADYGRFAVNRRAAEVGTYWGYFAGSTWMYIAGLLGGFAYLKSNPGALVYELAPNAIVLGTLNAMNLTIAGLILVVISTITTTFLDIYSTAASALNIFPKANERVMTIAGGLLGTVLAFELDMHSYVPFLLLIGVVFLPMFSIVAVDFLVIRHSNVDAGELYKPQGVYRYHAGFNLAALIAWIVGMSVSIWAEAPYWLTDIFGIADWAPFFLGKTIPSFIVSAVLYLFLYKLIYMGKGRTLKPVNR